MTLKCQNGEGKTDHSASLIEALVFQTLSQTKTRLQSVEDCSLNINY